MADDGGWLKRGSVESSEIRTYYDDFAETYDAQLSDWSYRAPEEVAHLLKQHCALDGAVFDAGCGTGLTGRALRAAGFSGAVDGADLSPRSVERAARRGIYRDVAVMNFQKLPLPVEENSYDAAICVGVLTYVPNAEGFLRDLARLVRPDGTIVFTHRDDLFASQDYAEMLKRLEAEGLWTRLAVSEPRDYLPDNPDFADDIRVIVCAFRVAG